MQRLAIRSVGVCSLSVFLLISFFSSAAQEQPDEKPGIETSLIVPDGSLEGLRDFVVKHYSESKRLWGLGQLKPDQTAPMEAVRAACEKILADPTISDEFQRWTLKKMAEAQIMLAHADPSKHYGRLLTMVEDYEAQPDCENLVKTIEKHILQLGIRIATTPAGLDNPRPLRLDFNALVERLLLYLEMYREPDSTLLVRDLLAYVKTMPPVQRDRMMLVAAEHLAPHYLKSLEANDKKLGRELQGTARLLSLPGKPMPLEGVLPTGEEFDPETLKGKVVLVQFWEPNCVHCRAGMALFVELLEQYGRKGFEVIGVCTQGGARTVQDFVQRTTLPDDRRITWPILVDELAPKIERPRLAEYFNIVETPVLVLIGRDGNVVRVNPLPSALPLEIEQALYPNTADEPE